MTNVMTGTSVSNSPQVWASGLLLCAYSHHDAQQSGHRSRYCRGDTVGRAQIVDGRAGEDHGGEDDEARHENDRGLDDVERQRGEYQPDGDRIPRPPRKEEARDGRKRCAGCEMWKVLYHRRWNAVHSACVVARNYTTVPA